MMGLSTIKLFGIGVGALALIALVVTILGWRSERNALRLQVAAACTATRDAAANPKLDCKDMPQQIRLLGQSIADLKAGIARQNAAVNALSDASAKAQQDAEKAVSAAKERVKAAQATADRLARSAGDPARGKRPCEASDALKESWR